MKVIEDNLNGTNKDKKKLYGDTDCVLAKAIQESIENINETKDIGIKAVDTDIEAKFQTYKDLTIDDEHIAKKLEAADKVTAQKYSLSGYHS